MFRFLVLAFAAIFRPRALLIAENLCLRQQLLVLQRRHPRPRLSNADRRFWILASRWFDGWHDLLLIAKPETVLGWHRRECPIVCVTVMRLEQPRLSVEPSWWLTRAEQQAPVKASRAVPESGMNTVSCTEAASPMT